MTKEESRHNKAAIAAWDNAVEAFKRRLAWADAHDPAAITRLLRCGVPCTPTKSAAPRCANIRDGKEKKSTYIISRARGVVKDD